MTELKPCPFCGGKAYIDVLLGKQYIQCFHKKGCLMKPDTWLISDNSIKKNKLKHGIGEQKNERRRNVF